MDEKEHKDRHMVLHGHLDELIADWISHSEGGVKPTKNPVVDLIRWSHQQSEKPDHQNA